MTSKHTVREIMPAAAPVQWAVFGCLLAILGSAVTVVFLAQQSRLLFGELEFSRKVQYELDGQWNRLILERSTLLSPAHVEKFVIAAETVAAVAVPEKPTPPTTTLMPPNRLAGRSTHQILERNGKSRYLSYPGQGRKIYRELPFGTSAKVRIQLSGLKSADGKAPRLTIEPYIDREIVAPDRRDDSR